MGKFSVHPMGWGIKMDCDVADDEVTAGEFLALLHLLMGYEVRI